MHGFQLQDLAAERQRDLRADAAVARRARRGRLAAAGRGLSTTSRHHEATSRALPGSRPAAQPISSV